MSAPLETPAYGNLFLGNTNDDDAAVIQSYVEPQGQGIETPYIQPIPDQSYNRPKVATRLMSIRQLILPAWEATNVGMQPAVPLLTEDLNRVNFIIRVISPTAVTTDGIVFSSDAGELQGTIPGGAPLLAGFDETITGHTGPLYARTFSALTGTLAIASAPVLVSVWAVTS